MDSGNNIAVIYLSYLPYGIEYLKRFIVTYVSRISGIPHDLIIVFNGVLADDDLNPYLEFLNFNCIPFSYIKSPAFYDIGSYFFAANSIKHKYVCFLNTYSQIQGDQWLLHLFNAGQTSNAGVIGCTGGWGDYSKIKYHVFSFSFIKSLPFWFVYIINFKKNLSPHIRTNAFFMDRKLFLVIKYEDLRPNWLTRFKYGDKEYKLKTLHFEHGKRSLSNQIKSKKLDLLIVDRHGKTYKINDWNLSKTFWSGNQENLMVTDNQTMKYENGSPQIRSELMKRAWGTNQINLH